MVENRSPSTSVVASDGLSGHAEIRALIRRRRLLDAAFAALGASLVIASLSVLAVLVTQLVIDGSGRLISSHEVKPDGFAPGMRDLVGTLRGAGTGGEWALARDPYLLLNVETVVDVGTLNRLRGQWVTVSGDIPAPGRLEMEITSIEPAEVAARTRFERDRVVGSLTPVEGGWTVDPAPIALDLSDVQNDPTLLADRRVVVELGMARELPLKARGIEPLVRQSFLSSMPSREAPRAGVKSALVGSFLVVAVTMLLAVPFGVASGIYLEEYGRRNWLTALIEINIANLAGIPSIVWGLMSLGLLVYAFGLGRSVLTAGITLGLLVLPIVIMSTREAIRTIPLDIREAAYACGASKWQLIRHHVFPYSLSGILTGSIIGLSRAIGETAPLITIGALTYVAFLPEFSWSSPFAWLGSSFTVLPIQIFNWVSRPDQLFQANAAAGGIILLALTLSMNAVAIALRYRLRKRIRW
jgi:phosphate transport system permease protein